MDPWYYPNGANILVIEGVPGTHATERYKGFKGVLGSPNPKYPILDSQPADWVTDKAQQVAENLLGKYDKVDVIWAMNDEMAMGALQAVKAAGRLKISQY